MGQKQWEVQLTFEEWFEQHGDKTHFDDKELGAAWELIKFFWDAGRKFGVDQGYDHAKNVCPARQCNLAWQDEHD